MRVRRRKQYKEDSRLVTTKMVSLCLKMVVVMVASLIITTIMTTTTTTIKTAEVNLFASAFVSPIRISTTLPQQQPQQQQQIQRYASNTAIAMVMSQNKLSKKMESSRTKSIIDLEKLRQLDSCQTGSAARRILEDAIPTDINSSGISSSSGSGSSGRRYESVQIPVGASDLKVSDADLTIQSGMRNKMEKNRNKTTFTFYRF